MSTNSALDKPFLKAADKALHSYHCSTFARYVAPHLKISAAPPNPKSNNVAFRKFVLSRSGYEDPPWLRTTLTAYFAPDAKARLVLMVKVDGGSQAQPLTSFLDALPAPSIKRMGREEGYERQWEWWQARKTVFNFSRLPEELQDMMLLQMIGEVRPLSEYWYPCSGWDLCRSCERPQHPSAMLQPTPLDAKMLHLNKSLDSRLQVIIRERTIKHFTCGRSLVKACRDLQQVPPDLGRSLTRLLLDFTDREYVHFFFNDNLPKAPGYAWPVDFDSASAWGVDVDMDMDRPTQPRAMTLRNIPNLRYLALWFHSTIYPRFEDPWHYANTESHQPMPYPCRKGMIDLIMTLAHPYINHIPNINMTGYVKTETRNKWLAIFQQGKDAAKRADIGRQVAAQRVTVLSEGNCPPLCECPKPCCYKEFLPLGIKMCSWDYPHGWTDSWMKCLREEYEFDFDDEYYRRREEGSEEDKKARVFTSAEAHHWRHA